MHMGIFLLVAFEVIDQSFLKTASKSISLTINDLISR